MIQLLVFPTQPGLINITAGDVAVYGVGTNFSSGLINKQITIRTTAGDFVAVIVANPSSNQLILSSAPTVTQSNCYFTTDFYELDVNQDFAYSFNYNIADIREPDKRNANYSKTITIPGTKNNNNILSQIFEINVDRNFNPNLRADALILEDSIQVFRGNLQLLQINKNKDLISYNIAVFGSLNDLFAKLAVQNVQGTTQINRLLTDLDLSAYNHVVNNEKIYNSWLGADFPVGEGYVYPLINNGLQDISVPATPITATNKGLIFNVQDMYVCFYTKTLIDAIFKSVGFTYQSNFLTSDFFKRLIIPSVKPVASEVTISFSINFATPSSGFGCSVTVFVRKGDGSPDVNAGTIGFASQTPANVSGSFTYSSLMEGDTFFISVFSGFSDVATGSTFGATYSNLPPYSLDYSFLVSNNANQSITGGSDTAIVKFQDATTPPNFMNNAGAYNPTTNFGQFGGWNLQYYLPDKVAQRDFLLWIIQMFNLYVMPDKYDPTLLYIEPRDSFYNSTIVDWSPKLDAGKEVDIIPMGELDSKYYQFGYKSDSDYYNQYYQNLYNENYGDKLICVNNDFLTQTKNINTGFSSTPSASAPLNPATKQPNNALVLPAIIANNSTGAGNSFTGNIRILYYGGQKNLPTGQVFYLQQGGAQFEYSAYPFAGMVDDPQAATLDLCFEQPRLLFWTYNNPASYPTNNLFNTYYSRFMAEISDKNAALVQMYLHLNITDIYQLDFRNLFFIKDCYYRLNKITDYNPASTDSVLVEFIKVNENVALPQPLQRAPNLRNLQGLTTISAQLQPGQLIIGSPSGIAQSVTLSKDIQVVLNEATGSYDLKVTGFQNIALSAAAPADGAQLEYNASLNRFEWTATASSGAFLQSGFSNGFS